MKALLTALCLVAFATFSYNVKRQLMSLSDHRWLASLTWGQPSPDFTLRDRAGKEYTLSELAPTKKLVMVNFWGTWCAPCRIEMPSFEKIYQDTANAGLEILAIDEEDSLPVLDAYLKKIPLSFPILRDTDGAVAKRYGIQAFPTTVFVGRDDKVVYTVVGVQAYLGNSVTGLIRDRDKKK